MTRIALMLLVMSCAGPEALPRRGVPHSNTLPDEPYDAGTCDSGCSQEHQCWFGECRMSCTPDGGWLCPPGYWCTFGEVCSPRPDGG